MFFKKATKIDEIFNLWKYVVSVKSTVKILSTFMAFLENTNFSTLFNGLQITVSLNINEIFKMQRIAKVKLFQT